MKNKKTRDFGPHLRIDAYNVKKDKLEDIETLFRLLNDLPDLIGVHKSGLPQIGEWKQASKKGITGFIVIFGRSQGHC